MRDAKAIDLVYVRQFANANIGRMTIYMLWDNDYFYLFAEIEDNTAETSSFALRIALAIA